VRDKQHPYALAIDIGGTKIATAVVGGDGALVCRMVTRTPVGQGAEAILSAAIALARQTYAEAWSSGLDVVAAGVGSAGHVDHRRGVITYASATLPGWSGLPLAERLEFSLGLPVVADNDVNAMAFGEHLLGAGRSFSDVLYLTVGTGIGGALIRDHQLWRGATWTAGELGHLLIDWDGGRRCNCGATGHLEAYSAGPAIAGRYRELRGLDEACDLLMVAELARGGDVMALDAIREGAQILGTALGGLLSVLDPQALIIGGGVAELGELWWQPLTAALRATPMPGPAGIELHPAALGVDAVLVGAGLLALKHNDQGEL
jgi:glucokinase